MIKARGSKYVSVLQADKEPKVLTYVAGSSLPYVMDAAGWIRRKHEQAEGEPPEDVIVVDGRTTSTQDMEAILLCDPWLGYQVTVMMHADQFTGWHELAPELKALPASQAFIAVDESGGISLPDDGIAKLFSGTKGRIINCGSLTDEERKQFVALRLPITLDAANFLVKQAKDDDEWLVNTVHKLEATGLGGFNGDVVKTLIKSEGTSSFELAFVTKRYADCLRSLQSKGANLSGLTRILKRVVPLYDYVTTPNITTRDLVSKTGFSSKEVQKLRQVALYYDVTTALRCYRSILKVGKGLRENNQMAFLALVARWMS